MKFSVFLISYFLFCSSAFSSDSVTRKHKWSFLKALGFGSRPEVTQPQKAFVPPPISLPKPRLQNDLAVPPAVESASAGSPPLPFSQPLPSFPAFPSQARSVQKP